MSPRSRRRRPVPTAVRKGAVGTPKTARRRYTEKQRARALALYVGAGPHQASRQLKIPVRTISGWARKAGLKTEAVARTTDATEAAAARRAAVREDLRTKLLDKALDVLGRMDAEHIDYKVVAAGEGASEILQVVYPRPTPTGVREYAVAVGILIDKYRLEMGEATGRNELGVSGGLTMNLGAMSDAELNAGLARVTALLGVNTQA